MKVNELANWRRGRLNDALVFFKNPVFSDLVRRSISSRPTRMPKIRSAYGSVTFQQARQYDRIMLLDDKFVKKMIIPDLADGEISYVSPSSRACGWEKWFLKICTGMMRIRKYI